MASIFISHSSHNNEEARKVADWLIKNGWQDIFLDLDPQRGIVAGQRWKEALQQAAHRCEVVLALVSPAWLSSGWCKSEVDAARLMGKRVIVALIGVEKSEIPPDLTDEQWIDLVRDPAGYQRLREGLKRAGLDPSTFVLAPGRRPYPGFAYFEEEDAAIFFGRDAQIVRAMDRMRSLVRIGVDRLLVMLGASGSGKSSFLRAGLRPRLQRDNRAWLSLPVIRPERAVISGAFGLVRALHQLMNEDAFAEQVRRRGLPRGRADIEDFVTKRSDGLLTLFTVLREIAQTSEVMAEKAQVPTIVVSIDQGEELFNLEGRDEALPFIDMLAEVLKADPHTLALMAMRSDAFPLLQNDAKLAAISKDTFTLDMMLEGSYRAVIEGPARIVDPPLTIDPQLVDALLEDISGQDALPLLAFTLAYLYDHYLVDNEISLAGYERLGRLGGVIDASVREALATGVAAGELPKDANLQLSLVRAAFIPHLVQVNATGHFIRRVAMVDEIPTQSKPVINHFADQRLLIMDRRNLAGKDIEVVEVAHEALLRQPPVSQLLHEDREFLVWRERLSQTRAAFEANERSLLVDRELQIAQDWLSRRAHSDIEPQDRAFINASIVAYDKRVAAEAERERQRRQAELEAVQARELAAQERAAAAHRIAQRTMIGLGAAVFLLVLACLAMFYAWRQQQRAEYQAEIAVKQEKLARQQRDEALRQTAIAQAGRLSAQANMLREGSGLADKSVVLAAQAVQLLKSVGKRSLDADLALRRALALMPRRMGWFEDSINKPERISGDGYVTLRHELFEQASVRSLPGGTLVGCSPDEIKRSPLAKGLPRSFFVAATTPNGSHCATVAAQADREWVIDIWSSAPVTHIASIQHTGGPRLRLVLSADAEFLAITDRAPSAEPQAGGFRIWSRSRDADISRQTGAAFIDFSPDQRFFAATNGVWSLPGSAQQHVDVAQVLPWIEQPWGLVFSRSGRHLALRSTWEGSVEVWKLSGDLPEKSSANGEPLPTGTLQAVDDSGRFIILSVGREDDTVLWDWEKGIERVRIPIRSLAAGFSERSATILAEEKGPGIANPYTRGVSVLALDPMGSALASLDSNPGERILWLGAEGHDIRMLIAAEGAMRFMSWDVPRGAPVLKFSATTAKAVNWAISANARRVAIGSPDGIMIGGYDGHKEVVLSAAPGPIAINADGHIMATTVGRALQAWHLDTGARWTFPPIDAEVASLQVSDDGQYALAVTISPGEASRSGDAYQLVRWSLAKEPEIKVVPLGRHLDPPALECIVSKDGTSIILQGGVRMDIAAASTSSTNIEGMNQTCVSVVENGIMQAAINEKHVIVTDTQVNEVVARLEHPGKVERATLSSDGSFAATSDEYGTVRIWALDPAELIAQACARGLRPLDAEEWDRYMPLTAQSDPCGRAHESSKSSQ